MDELLRLLRPDPVRDGIRLASGVLLAVGMTLMSVRMEGTWNDLSLFLVVVVPSVALFGLAALGTRANDEIQRWQSAFLVAAVLLLFATLVRFGELIGVEDPTSKSGAMTWLLALTASGAAVAAWKVGSAVNALLASFLAGASFLFFIDWVKDDPGVRTYRWVLVGLAAVFALLAFLEHHRRREHSRYLVNTAGVAAVAGGVLGSSGAVLPEIGFLSLEPLTSSGDGWETFLLLSSLALIAYAAWQRYRGPAYIGAVGLVAFVGIVGEPVRAALSSIFGVTLSQGSIAGWPLLLTLVGLIGLAVSLSASGLGRASSSASGAGAPPRGGASEPPRSA